MTTLRRCLLPATASALLAALVGFVVLLAAPPARAAGAVVADAGCAASTLAPNDDGSTPEVPLGFPLDFFGTRYDGVYVNNNGDVTFGAPFSGYSGLQLAAPGIPIIAVAFYDVDTLGAGSQPVRYGQTTYEGRPAFCASWLDVGYFPRGTDRLNRFQLLLVDRSDTGAGNFDMVMNYDRLVYEPGGGLTVGYSNGADVSAVMPGSGEPGALVDANPATGLVHGSVRSPVPGRYVFPVRGGTPTPPTAQPLAQTIDFPQPPDTAVGVAPFAVGASASSGLPVTVTAEGVCTADGRTVTVTGAGTCTLTASQPGGDGVAAAEPVTRSVAVAKGAATLAITGTEATYDGTPHQVEVTTTPAGLPGVTVTYAGAPDAPTAAGAYAVEATLDHVDWQADAATATLVVGPADQTVAFPEPPDATFGDAPLALDAVASSGLPVRYTTSGPCTVVEQALRLDGAGTCAVTAHQDGDADHRPAPSVTETVEVARAAQTIDFSLDARARIGQDPVVLEAVATSGLPVTYVTSGPCAARDATLSLLGGGTCAVTAVQPGDADHLAAADVVRTVDIAKATAVVALADLDQVADGTPRPVRVDTFPAGLSGISVTYDGALTAPRAPGRYEVAASLDHPLFTAEAATGTLVVRAPAPTPKPTPAPKPTPLPKPTPPAAVRPVPAPSGDLPALAPGASLALLDGRAAPVTVAPAGGERLVVRGAGFRASVGAVDERGAAVDLDTAGHVRLRQGQRVAVDGSGFAPGSRVAVWLFSTPRLLGTVAVDPDGSFGGRLPVPADLPAGRHTVQMNGTAARGGERSLSLGVRVDAAPTRTVASPSAAPAPLQARTPAAFDAAWAGVGEDGVGDEGVGDDGVGWDATGWSDEVRSDDDLLLLAATPDGTGAAVDTFGDVPVDPSAGADVAAPAAPLPSLSTVPADRGEPAAGGVLAAFDPLSDAPAVVSSQVALYALLTLTGAAAAPRRVTAPAGGGADGGGGGRRKGKVTSAKVKHHKFRWEGAARGDGSRTWRWPGTAALDRAGHALPLRLAPVSPLLARIAVDGAYLRAMVGAFAWLLPVAGAVLGAVAVASSGGAALPPATGLVVAVALLGVVDAAAGLVAVAVFAAGVVAGGGLDTADSVRTLLGIASLWFAAPLIAAAARPLRRPAAAGTAFAWDRVGDVVIATLIGGWAVQKMVGALPGLSGYDLPIAASADAIALAVMGALVARTALEELASRWYPERLATVAPERVPFSGTPQRLAATGLRVVLFAFVAVAFVGWCWQLAVGAALFAAPQVASIVEDRFPNLPRLHAVLPRGVTKLVVMLAVGSAAGALVTRMVADPARMVADAFVLLALPGFALSCLGLVGRDGPRPTLTWAHQVAGAALVLGGTTFVLLG